MKKWMLMCFAPLLLPTMAQAQSYDSGAETAYCREYTRDVKVGNRLQEGYGTACMQPDGSWKIVNSPEAEAAPTPEPVPTEVAYAPQPVVYEPIPVYAPSVYHPSAYGVYVSSWDIKRHHRSRGWREHRHSHHEHREHERHHGHGDWERHHR